MCANAAPTALLSDLQATTTNTNATSLALYRHCSACCCVGFDSAENGGRRLLGGCEHSMVAHKVSKGDYVIVNGQGVQVTSATVSKSQEKISITGTSVDGGKKLQQSFETFGMVEIFDPDN